MTVDKNERSDQPLPAALRTLMANAGLSFRGFATATAPHRTPPLSQTYISELVQEHRRATVENMVTLAKAAGVKPEFFLEYRQHLAATRAAELVAIVGLDVVMQTLDLAEREIPLRDLEAAVQQHDTRDGSRASSDHAQSPKGH